MYLLCLGDPTGSGTASLLTLALNTYKSKVQWVTITIIEFTNPSKNSRHLHVNFQKYYSVQDTHLSESEEKRKEFHDKTNYYLWLVCNDLATVDTWNFFYTISCILFFAILGYQSMMFWIMFDSCHQKEGAGIFRVAITQCNVVTISTVAWWLLVLTLLSIWWSSHGWWERFGQLTPIEVVRLGNKWKFEQWPAIGQLF